MNLHADPQGHSSLAFWSATRFVSATTPGDGIGLLDDPFDNFGTEEFNSLEERTANINSADAMHLVHIAFSPVERVTARWNVINLFLYFRDWVKTFAVNAAFHRDGAHFMSSRDILENEWRLEDAGEEVQTSCPAIVATYVSTRCIEQRLN